MSSFVYLFLQPIQEKYSKGMIPLSAISTVRVQGDNKFEVVTTQRTFVFRVEKEGKMISLFL